MVVEHGQIHALVGLNGAGKTTLMRLLLGMLVPEAGSVMILGVPVARTGRSVWGRVGHMIDTTSGYPELTVAENLRCAALLKRMEPATTSQTIARSIADLRLDRWVDRRAGALSSGNRQRLGLAGALINRPEVVVLDEPTAALDPAGVLLVRAALREAAGRGAAVLVSSHHLDEISRVADTISVMHRGRIVGNLPPGGVDLERAFFDLLLQIDDRDGHRES
nr:ABC transporter ATP-binding protein [Microlunatus panaciterrae]